MRKRKKRRGRAALAGRNPAALAELEAHAENFAYEVGKDVGADTNWRSWDAADWRRWFAGVALPMAENLRAALAAFRGVPSE